MLPVAIANRQLGFKKGQPNLTNNLNDFFNSGERKLGGLGCGLMSMEGRQVFPFSLPLMVFHSAPCVF